MPLAAADCAPARRCGRRHRLAVRSPALCVAVASATLRAAGRRRFAASTGTRRRRCGCSWCFGAMVLPLASRSIRWPRSTRTARRDRHVDRAEYAPATAQHPQELRAPAARTRSSEIDRLPELPALVSTPPARVSVDTQTPFTSGARRACRGSRVTSDIELYGPTARSVSRFALNLPEYIYRASGADLAGHRCAGRCSAKSRASARTIATCCTPNAALRRRRRLARRGRRSHRAATIRRCRSSRRPIRTTTSSACRRRQPAGSRLADLQVVVYGWSLQPLFASGRVAWPICRATVRSALPDRASRSGTTLPRRRSALPRVLRRSDRGGVYALGYPAPTVVRARDAARRGRRP